MTLSINKKYVGRIKSYRPRTKTVAIVTHHSGDGGRASIESVITTLNTRTNDKGQIMYLGYHYIIDRAGTIFQMVEDDKNIVYHCSEANATTIGISLLGAEANILQVQLNSALRLIQELRSKYGLGPSAIYGHGEIEPLLKATFGRKTGGKQPDEGLRIASLARGIARPPGDDIYRRIVEGYTPGRGTAAILTANATSVSPGVVSTIGQPNSYPVTSPNIGSLDSFHPNIQYELTRRRISENTADVHMPFVKLTSLVNVLGENVLGGTSGSTAAWCPSLGIHGRDMETFDATYLSAGNRSIIGYAMKSNGKEKPSEVPVIVSEEVSKREPKNIPMPGITEISAERGTAGPMGVRGGLMKAELKILAYSVGQLDTLLRYFLRPATRVVLEWGRASANKSQPNKPFDWQQDADTLSTLFQKLVEDSKEQTKFIEEYVYNNFGNYEIFIGYVVKFNVSVNKNNLYELSLTVHSVQQFEIPTNHTGVKSLCSDATNKCEAMDIKEYFDEQYSWKQKTFSKLMAYEEDAIKKANANKTNYQWNGHIIPVRDTSPTAETSQGNSADAGTKQAEYFVSWQFFVEKILNDPNRGILSLIDGSKTQQLLKLGLLKPTTDKVESGDATENGYYGDNKLVANEVGYHPDLRSTNPEVMVVYNQTAQNRRTGEDKLEYKLVVDLALSGSTDRETVTKNNYVEESFKVSKVGSFKNIKTAQNLPGVGTLFDGIWLNTKAIKQAFMSADLVSSAIESLLAMMNTATEGYWNLQLYSTDRHNPGMFVMDYGLSKPLIKKADGDSKFPWIDEEENEKNNVLDSINKVKVERYRASNDEVGKNKPKYIYMFNRGLKVLKDSTAELGSDIVDLKVEFNLPQVIAVQAIAGVGGPAQKSLLQSIDIPELNRITLIKDIFPPCLTETNSNSPCPDNSPCQDENQRTLEERIRELENTSLPSYDRIGLPSPKPRIQQSRNIFDKAAEFIAGGTTIQGQERVKEEVNRDTEYTKLQKSLTDVKIERAFGSKAVIDKVRELSGLGTTLDLIEFNPSKMLKKLNVNSRNAEAEQKYATPYAHAFNSSNLTKTIVNITLPGIGGIELFQSFLVDRVPSILQRGFYIVTKVSHKFAVDSGWTTSIEGRFRYRPENEGTGNPFPDCYGPSKTLMDKMAEDKGIVVSGDPGQYGDS